MEVLVLVLRYVFWAGCPALAVEGRGASRDYYY